MLNNDHESFAAAQARAAAAVSCESVVLPSGLTVLCRTMPGYSSVHAIYATGFGPSTARSGWTANRSHCPPVRRISWSTKCARRPRATPSPSRQTGASANALPAMTAPATCSRRPRTLTRTLTFCWAWSASRGSPRPRLPGSRAIIGQEIKMYDDSPRLAAAERAVPLPLRRPPAARRHRGHGGEHCRADAPDALAAAPGGSTRRPIWC